MFSIFSEAAFYVNQPRKVLLQVAETKVPFLMQIAVTVACFTITREEKARMITKSWEKASEAERYKAEVASDCCGFKNAFYEQGVCAEV